MAAPPSPRLPSPPPFTEVQIEPPQSDSAAAASSSPTSKPTASISASPSSSPAPAAATATKTAPATTRRIRPGTRSRDINTGPSSTAPNELDSAFQLQEHLASLLAEKTTITNPGSSTPHSIPISKESAQILADPPAGVDAQLWCYELTRRLTRDLNHLIVALLQDNCTNKTCPQMRASEWQYLCAVHDPPQSCCAIDYSCHTLDHAATILTSSRYFPSRLSLTAQGGKHLSSIFRRLYRIFAHAWFQHREVFWEVEGEWGLYLFFKTVSERYNLIPEDNLTIPPEAERGAEMVDEFSRGGVGEEGPSTDEEDEEDKEKKEGNDEDDEEEDYGSDESDESDEHSESGSSSDDAEGVESDAFGLELAMEEGREGRNENEAASGEERIDSGEEDKVVAGGIDGKGGADAGNSEEEGEEIPLIMEQEDVDDHTAAQAARSRSPSPPGNLTPPPSSPSPPPAEEDKEEKKEGEDEQEPQIKPEVTASPPPEEFTKEVEESVGKFIEEGKEEKDEHDEKNNDHDNGKEILKENDSDTEKEKDKPDTEAKPENAHDIDTKKEESH